VEIALAVAVKGRMFDILSPLKRRDSFTGVSVGHYADPP
jgi:hypothetical protein